MNFHESFCYAQRQRLQYIESVAYWEGKVDRPRVSRVFELSENHITKDFTAYRKAFPENLSYDVSARVYRPGRNFEPRIGSGSPEEYLSLLRAFHETTIGAVLPPVGNSITAVGLPFPSGNINPKVLREMTRALSQLGGVTITYQSLSTPQPTRRDIWPHALVYAGHRWHVRAYDDLRKKFVDFVLLRIIDAQSLDLNCPVSFETDYDWHTTESIAISPVSNLSTEQQAIVAAEYGMQKNANEEWFGAPTFGNVF
jgi:hypothetical protein